LSCTGRSYDSLEEYAYLALCSYSITWAMGKVIVLLYLQDFRSGRWRYISGSNKTHIHRHGLVSID
jgi:hypothetical protein